MSDNHRLVAFFLIWLYIAGVSIGLVGVAFYAFTQGAWTFGTIVAICALFSLGSLEWKPNDDE